MENTKEFTQLPDNIKHSVLKQILEKAQIKHVVNLSHKNGSHYWTIDGNFYRVSDHSKPEGSFGYESFKDGNGDFRSYNDFYLFLNGEFDLSDKSKSEIEYKKRATKYIKSTADGFFIQPDGSKFDNLDNALNNMWRLKKQLPIELEKMTQLQELRTLIVAELALCDMDTTPKVCSMYASDPAAIIDLVQKYVLTKTIKIGEAIVQVEKDFNPNVIED